MDQRGVSPTAAVDIGTRFVLDTKTLITNEKHRDQKRNDGYHERNKHDVYIKNQLLAYPGVIDDIHFHGCLISISKSHNEKNC